MATLYLDIETVPDDAFEGMDLANPPGWVPTAKPVARKPPANYRDPAKIEEWLQVEHARVAEECERHAAVDAQAAREWYGAKSLDAHECRVLVAGFAVDDDEPEALTGDEYGVLSGLLGVMDEVRPVTLVLHNGAGFDLPTLQVRAMRHGLGQLGRRLNEGKPWDGYIFDTCREWPTTRGGRFPKGASLDALCRFFGWERPDNPISGAQVLDAYVAGRLPDIVAHCMADIRDLRRVAQVLAEVKGRML